MEMTTERIAVLKFSRLELAQALAADGLSEEAKQKMRAWLTGENQEIVDGLINVKALPAGNGHAEPDLPATRKAMRQFRKTTRRGKKTMLHTRKSAKHEELCKFCGKPYGAHGWLVSHEARCAQNPEGVTKES